MAEFYIRGFEISWLFMKLEERIIRHRGSHRTCCKNQTQLEAKLKHVSPESTLSKKWKALWFLRTRDMRKQFANRSLLLLCKRWNVKYLKTVHHVQKLAYNSALSRYWPTCTCAICYNVLSVHWYARRPSQAHVCNVFVFSEAFVTRTDRLQLLIVVTMTNHYKKYVRLYSNS